MFALQQRRRQVLPIVEIGISRMSSAPIYNFNQAVSADAFEVEEFRRRTRLHEKEAAEIEKSVSSIKPSRRIRMKRSGGDDATQQSAGSAEDEGVSSG
ncbi:hypothetical protein FOZ63_001971 [Perkinsus olseni]|uniref:Uncharacterized protein n=1 Tax=Perkinsus olseni TaxID=32597 RepID=A0A7J6N6H5_PEROL|nr:hypothetical protein FOZ63_001971 [Perkinsus olseni]